MLVRNHNLLPTGYAESNACRDAVDGFAAIASALDHGMDLGEAHGSKLVDTLAIGLGWVVLASIIFCPQLQLAAIAACASFLLGRSLVRFAFAPNGSSQGTLSNTFTHQVRRLPAA
jgi:hypothetical protein